MNKREAYRVNMYMDSQYLHNVIFVCMVCLCVFRV